MARAELPADAAPARLAVIAMGKCGGRELNYISDVDVVFVAEPRRRRRRGGRAARRRPGWPPHCMRACSAQTAEGSIWEVDAGLRPEGKSGRAGAHAGQPRRLLRALGQDLGVPGPAQGPSGRRRPRPRRARTSTPWRRWCGRPPTARGFVEDVQAMRRRVEEHIPAREADRQLKLGVGRPARRRVRRAAAAARARPVRHLPAQRQHARRARVAGDAGGTSGATTRRAWPRPTASCAPWSTASSCTGCGAPTWCPTDPDDLRRIGALDGLPRRRRRGARTRVAPARAARSAGCTRSCSTGRCSTPSPGSSRGRPG